MASRAHTAPKQLHTSNDIKKIYTIKEHLGQGTTGKVYRCSERRAKQPAKDYAMKVIDKSQAKESQMSDIYQEIGLLQILENEHIANVKEIYEAPSTIFIIMELAEGGDLRDLTYPLSERAAAVMMRSILQALEYIHSQGVAHRDIKLDNILLSRPIPEDHDFDPDSNPEDLRVLADLKLADFGYACKTTGNDMARCCGTPYYIAPEVLLHGVFEKGGRYSKQVDMWSAGVAAYVLLSGHLPFELRNRRRLYRAIVKEPVKFWEGISPSAKGFLKGLLDRNPATRMTPTQALQHPWIMTEGAGQDDLMAIGENRSLKTDSVVGFSECGSSGSELSLLWPRTGTRKETCVPSLPVLPGAVLDEAHMNQPEGAARNYTITERSETDAQREQDRPAPPTAWASTTTPPPATTNPIAARPRRMPSLPVSPPGDMGPLRAPVVAFEDPTSPTTPVKFMAKAWSTMRSAVRF